MTTIVQNVDLAPTHQGFETCAAQSFDVSLYSGNWFAAFSVDGASTFSALSPYDFMKLEGEAFCCDQRVEFVPNLGSFVWVMLSMEGPLILAIATPDEIRSSNGTSWTYYHITPAHFRYERSTFDYPQISYGDGYLYLTVDAPEEGGAVIVRMPLGQLAERVTVNAQYVKTPMSFVCPCHRTQNVGWFAAIDTDKSQIRAFSWNELPSSPVQSFTVNIASVPVLDFSSLTPDKEDWLPPTSKISANITGAARTGREMVLAWSAGRKYADDSPSVITQPHIELAYIDMFNKSLIRQGYIWNRAFAFAWPSLAANGDDRPVIGISLCWGGPDHYPQHAVGTLDPRHLITTTSGKSAGAGGHYNDVRMGFPDYHSFVAAGFNAVKDNSTPPKVMDHPHFVVFRP
jgi:hypothetical protein